MTASTDLVEVYKDFKDEIHAKASSFQERDSGWSLKRLMFLDVNINKFNPISASSYIKLPKQIVDKKAILNIQNKDNGCFAWSITAAISHANGEPTRVSSYPHYNTLLNFKDIEFPVKLKDISKFEELNNISVNVFGLEKKFENGKYIIEVVGPLHFTSNHKPTHVNLLLISDDHGNNHYCLIKNLSRLVSKQLSNRDGAIYLCDGCLQVFRTRNKLHQHEENDCNHLCSQTPTTEVIINKYGESVP